MHKSVPLIKAMLLISLALNNPKLTVDRISIMIGTGRSALIDVGLTMNYSAQLNSSVAFIR